MAQSNAPQWPAVSIVVPVYQGESLIGQCLESLLRLDYPEHLREILIIDNASTDRTAEIVRQYPVRLISEPRKGAVIACNTGWKTATHDLIAFTDCDCTVGENWLKALVARMTGPEIGGCGGQLAAAPPQNLVQEYIVLKNILSQDRALESHPASPPFVVSANVVYRRSVLEEVGGFDEELRGAGYDADLAWRIRWAGYEIVYEPQAVVWHHHRATLGSFMGQLRGYGSGECQLFAKHRERFGMRRYFNSQPYRQILKALARTPISLVMGKTKMARLQPMLEILDSFSYLRGKWEASLKYRVFYL